jgi:hypothetical protein
MGQDGWLGQGSGALAHGEHRGNGQWCMHAQQARHTTRGQAWEGELKSSVGQGGLVLLPLV